MKRVNIASVFVDNLTFKDAISRIESSVKDNSSCSHVVTPNPEMIVEAMRNKKFLNVLNRAELSLPDGVGVLVAAEVLSKNIPNIPVFRGLLILYAWIQSVLRVIVKRRPKVLKERVSGVDVVYGLFNMGRPLSVFLFGGLNEDVLKQAAQRIEGDWSNIDVVGYDWGGKIDNHGDGERDNELIRKINATAPDVLLVGIGSPKQDLWISKNLGELNVGVAMGVGGTIDFIAKVQKRAPRIVRKLGFEWFWRLLLQPSRIKRIINAIVVFPFYVSRYKLHVVKSTHGADY